MVSGGQWDKRDAIKTYKDGDWSVESVLSEGDCVV
jgi:hypothetical protein